MLLQVKASMEQYNANRCWNFFAPSFVCADLSLGGLLLLSLCRRLWMCGSWAGVQVRLRWCTSRLNWDRYMSCLCSIPVLEEDGHQPPLPRYGLLDQIPHPRRSSTLCHRCWTAVKIRWSGCCVAFMDQDGPVQCMFHIKQIGCFSEWFVWKRIWIFCF